MQAYAWKRPTAPAMASATPLFFFFFFFLFLNSPCTFASAADGKMSHQSAKFDRGSFPAGFVFGSGSSSYQVEGAASEFGRGPSIWDVFTHNEPDKIADRSTGDVADGFYYYYKEDIAQMKAIGFDAFRFSISWSRIFPNGKLSGGFNPLGVQFYNDLIDNILLNGLNPYVTLFHWDLPQALDDEYGGFLSHVITNDYLDYVDFCFKTYGDRVKYWFTVNEPYEFSALGYAKGIYAPGRCSNYVGNCTLGNSATEPYIVGHHLLLSHAAAVRLYREKYKASQKGQIGVTLSTKWYEPFSNDNVSRKAALRAVDFALGWFLHPITCGNYPQSMQSLVGNRLPKFTKKETQMLKESFDFLGINYYSSYYAADAGVINTSALSMTTDNHIIEYKAKNGVPIGRPTDLDWLYICPDGLRKLLLFIKNNYGNPTIIVTENGLAELKNSSAPVGESLKDELRIHCYYEHLKCLLKAIKEGADVRGYFIWSFIDNFEWSYGYNARFGITYVDYKGGLRRYLKDSAIWFSEFLQGRINALFRPSTYGLPEDQSSVPLIHANK